MRTTIRRYASVARRGLTVTTFTQSAGNELLTNGGFSTWTGDNPDSWTVTGEVGSDPMVTQVAPTGGVGTGAARFYSSATSTQPRLSQTLGLGAGVYIEMAVVVSVRTSNNMVIDDGNSANGLTIATASTQTTLRRTLTGDARLYTSGTPADFVVDSVSFKRLTLNTQRVANLNAAHTFFFTLPGSPVGNQEVHLCYRIPASDPFLNSWDAYLRRNATNTAWDFRLDSISAGTRTNRVNVTGVGTPDAIRVVTSGDNHTCYTGVSGTYTARGATVTNNTHNTATGINTIYSSAVTPVRLESA